MFRKLRVICAVGVAVLLIAGAAFALSGHYLFASGADTRQASAEGGANGPSIGGPFTLVGADGQTVTDETYRGKWMMVYFGYTFCPDVCPTTLNNIAQALAKLGPDASAITPLFITVDPARDTPKVMGDYVKSFDPRIIGLSGTPAQTAAVAKEYHVYYAPQPAEDGNYLIDHSSFIYFMNPKGVFVKVMPGDTAGDAMADAIRQLVGSTS